MTISERQNQLAKDYFRHMKLKDPKAFCRKQPVEVGIRYEIVKTLRSKQGVKQILGYLNHDINNLERAMVVDPTNLDLLAKYEIANDVCDDIRDYEKEMEELGLRR